MPRAHLPTGMERSLVDRVTEGQDDPAKDFKNPLKVQNPPEPQSRDLQKLQETCRGKRAARRIHNLGIPLLVQLMAERKAVQKLIGALERMQRVESC